MTAPTIVWYRQDLRIADQRALATAAQAGGPVVAIYVLDDAAAGRWAIGGAQRWWLHHSLVSLARDLDAIGVPLVLRRGDAVTEIVGLAEELGATQVHALRHYEPWWKTAQDRLGQRIALDLHDGALLDDPDRVRTGSGGRYRMFTPFWRALRDRMPPPAPIAAPAAVPRFTGAIRSDRLEDWALLPTKPDWATGFSDWTPGEAGAQATLATFVPRVTAYGTDRNLPSMVGSSRLSPHLHHGEISPATVWHAIDAATGDGEPFLREVGWRDFTSNVIDILPDYADVNGRTAWNRFPWRTGAAAEADFRAWTHGRTGYPIVDAGMRQMWATGWMHNRVRMIAASFQVKHLLIDWRRGETWFWDCLVDADYGNNAVNWQWIAGTGIDSNPFGRIMAPLVQSPKFDAAAYIRQWVPELRDVPDDSIHDPDGAGRSVPGYPPPLIAHREARERALSAARSIAAEAG